MNLHQNKTILTWEHICNAISHEVHHSLSDALADIIENDKIKDDAVHKMETVQKILQKLRKKANISAREIEYLKRLINRAVNANLFIQSSKTIPNDQQGIPTIFVCVYKKKKK